MIKTFIKQLLPKYKIRGKKIIQDFKAPSLNIATLQKVEKLVFPLSSSKGKRFASIVTENESVKKGQVLAQGKDVNIIAPMDGVIIFKENSIELIPSNNKFTSDFKEYYKINLTQHKPEDLLQKIQDANIEGLGGALFPAYKKANYTTIKHIILNAVECEPITNTDEALMTSHLCEVLSGGLILQKITNAEDISIAIKYNKWKLIKHIKTIQKKHPEFKDIKIEKVPNIYPAGAAKQVIKFLFGETIPSKVHATTQGFLVQNVMTSFYIHQAVAFNQPQTSRVVSIFGKHINNPTNMLVPIGATLEDIFTQLNINTHHLESVRLGGLMMGKFIKYSNFVSVEKNHNAIILNTQQRRTSEECINCGECIRACPLGLEPKKMLFEINNQSVSKKTLNNLEVCMNCNLCNYVCPSQINLTEKFKEEKKIQVQIEFEKQEDKRLKTLIKQKQERVSAQKQELEAKRKARIEKRQKEKQDV